MGKLYIGDEAGNTWEGENHKCSPCIAPKTA